MPLQGEDELEDEASLEERAQIERLAAFMDNSWEDKFYKPSMSANKPSTYLTYIDLS